jgi:CheY-like chemotaxis protein
MIVDDSVMMRVVLRAYVNTLDDFEIVSTPENGKKALMQLANFPDLSFILLDLEMPEMDGFDFLSQARSKTKAKIIVLSALLAPDYPYAQKNIERCKKLGADAVVSKPSGTVSVDLADKRGEYLLEVMQNFLENS